MKQFSRLHIYIAMSLIGFIGAFVVASEGMAWLAYIEHFKVTGIVFGLLAIAEWLSRVKISEC